MDDNRVPYIVFEGEMARHERTIKRLVIALIISISLIFISNIAWLWFFNQFDITSEDIIVDGTQQGNANFIGEDGMSGRRGRAANGRFVSRDGSDMARQLRSMMNEAPDEQTRRELQRVVEKMENM